MSSSSYHEPSSSSSPSPTTSSPSPLASSSSASHRNFDAASNPGPLLSHTNNLILDIVVPIVAVLLILGGFIFFRRARKQKAIAEKERARTGFVEMGGSPIRGGGGLKEVDLESGVAETKEEGGGGGGGGWTNRESRRSRRDLS